MKLKSGENDVENIRIHFSDLLKVFQEHCDAEEKILKELDYSRLDHHKREHNRLIDKGAEALSRCEHTQAESTFCHL